MSTPVRGSRGNARRGRGSRQRQRGGGGKGAKRGGLVPTAVDPPYKTLPEKDVRYITQTIEVKTLPLPVTVQSQVIYREEEDEEYDPDKHEPSRAYLDKLAATSLTGDTLYEDAWAESNYQALKPTAEQLAQFRAYIDQNHSFQQNIAAHSSNSTLAIDRAARNRMAVETTEEGANARHAIQGNNVAAMIDRLTALDPAALEIEERNRFLPPPTLADVDRIATVATRPISTNDLRQLLIPDYLPPLSPAERAKFLAMPCVNTIVRGMQPYMSTYEQDKQHYNIDEITDYIVSLGCKWVTVTRVETPERLANVVDPEFFGTFLKHDKRTNSKVLIGGHEHYDARNMRTRLVLVTSRCVLRPRATEEERQKEIAQRAVGIAEQMARENAQNADLLDPEDDLHNPITDRDDDYTGGNDLYNAASKFILCCTFVFVQCVDCEHANEALEPESLREPVAPGGGGNFETPLLNGGAPVLDDSEVAFGQEDDAMVRTATALAVATQPAYLPDGIGDISPDCASVMVGKHKESQYRAHCHGSNPFFPLCFRGFKFSTGATAFQ